MKKIISLIVSAAMLIPSFVMGAETVSAADTVAVSYSCSGVVVKSEYIDADLSSGTYTYYVSAYVEGTDGGLYATAKTATQYKRTSASSNVTEEVTLVTSDAHQYKDFNDVPTYAKPEYASGGRIWMSGTQADILTVDEDGIYSVTIAVGSGGRGIGNGSKNGSVLLNSAEIAYFSYSNTTGVINEITNLRLSENDIISITGPNARAAVDYILLKKTGDVPYPVPAYQSGFTRNMEKLDRGLVAVNTSRGIYLSWRLLGTESLTNQAFDIYRDGEKIHTTGSRGATNYTDSYGASSSRYIVVRKGESIDNQEPTVPLDNYINYISNDTRFLNNKCSYFDIMTDTPDPAYPTAHSNAAINMTQATYTANDASVGDLDGDGEYEIILKWDPDNSKDNSEQGFTSNVYIDAYKTDGTGGGADGHRLWRIDLGKNIRAGAHYTQFIVYDLDCDGKAEIAMRTAPGSVDGQGNYVTDAGDTYTIRNANNTADYRNSVGYVLDGPEYLTVFDGETGAALCTTDFSLKRGTVNDWGDNYGNRVDRFLAGVAYIDGMHPSLIMTRGYYALTKAAAYNFDGTEIKQIWQNISTTANYYTVTDSKGNITSYNSASLFGQGNHSLSVCDADNDGYDEIVFGSAVIDNDGTVLNSTGHGHGDAHHVSDFDNDGYQEIFQVHEDKGGYETELRKAIDAKLLAYQTSNADNGRGVMDNVLDDTNYLAQFWSSSFGGTYASGNESDKPVTVFSERPAANDGFINSLVYWDGDLARELIDDIRLGKVLLNGGRVWKRFMFGTGSQNSYFPDSSSTNGTKGNQCLTADILGDWREEVIMRRSDGNALRVFISAEPTQYRLHTLMHDSQYRSGVASENIGYNQPPHTSYYIGRASLAADSEKTYNYLSPATPYTSVKMVEQAKEITVDADGKRITMKNTAGVQGVMYAVYYDRYRKMVSFEQKDTSEDVVYLNGNEYAETVKVIWWDEISSLNPICRTKTVKLTE